MKRIFLLFGALTFAACAPKSDLTVELTNASSSDKFFETVELDVASLQVAAPQLNPENITVLDRKGRQIPCQVYEEVSGLKTLVFQASVPAGRTVNFYLAAGEREDFPTMAYSRYVPEREDDFAYENNLIAGRVYGPALKSPRTLGSDIWVKCTDSLVVDKWFREALESNKSYHENHGQGMDCYKVAQTLGGGALVPLDAEGRLVFGDNYDSQMEITSGPVRTKAALTYGFALGNLRCTVLKELTLDANCRFVKSSQKFFLDGDAAEIEAAVSEGGLKVALAAVKHDVVEEAEGANWTAFTEKASDSRQPDVDGNISVALVLPDTGSGIEAAEIDSHAALVTRVPLGKAVVSWTGSGWSQGGIESPEAWTELVSGFAEGLENPLKLIVSKGR